MSCRGGPDKTCASKNDRLRESCASSGESPLITIGSFSVSAWIISASIECATTPIYDLKTNLKAFHSCEFPLHERGLPNSLASTSAAPPSAAIPPDHRQLFSCARTGKSDHSNSSAAMCNEMNCDDSARAIFLSHAWMDESSCASQKEGTTQTEKLLTTERRTAHKPRNCAKARKNTLRRSEEGRSTGVSLGTKNRHHCLTPAQRHTQCNNVTLGRRLPIQPSAVGNKSLMWPDHITRTPGCSTPPCSVPLTLHPG